MTEKTAPGSAGRSRVTEADVRVSGDAVVGTIEIDAPPERVFRALTTPEELRRWWGSPETYRITEWRADVRVGGAWRCSGPNAGGGEFSVHGTYLEVEPPRRLAYTWNPSWITAPETTVRYELTALDGGTRTRVQVRHSGFGAATSARDDHRSGWPLVLNWLRAWSEARQSSEEV